MLQFNFLGAPRLENNNRPLALDTRKAIALAAYLTLTGTAHERDELAAFLYPDAAASRARAALRRTLSTLKTALGENLLTIERETVSLNTEYLKTGALRVDVLEFRALAEQNDFESLTRAAQLYQGDFLAGFTLRDSPEFDEWQFFETESLRKQFASVLEKLVGQQTAQRAYPRAIEYARRWLALDPLNEDAHRALMLLYARDGQRAAALRQYRECMRQLDQELGVAPLSETTELFRAIEENHVPTDEASGYERRRRTTNNQPPDHLTTQLSDQPTRRPSDFPLVGRARELESLSQAYSGIREHGQLLILEGEAGIGKTRLAQEFLQRAAERGATILTARSYPEQRALAYAPFVSALRAAWNEPALAQRLAQLPPQLRADAARLVPELARNDFDLQAETGTGAQARFLDVLTQVILRLLANGAPGILFLDDAQWLDEASLDLLAFLVRRLNHAPIALLLTWRGAEVAKDHALRRLYADELRYERAHLISLTRLAPRDVQLLVNTAVRRGALLDDALAERLYRESEGQPFFLVEMLKLIEREGRAPTENELPASVRELLHSRLAFASESARQLLSAAAVIGRSFDFEILNVVSGRGELETLGGLEELTAQGLVVELAHNGAVQYDFTHEKLRALVYEETSLARRRLLHRRAADALLHTRATGDPLAGQSAGQVARHYRAGGDELRAAEFYKRAGDYAQSVFANREAVENYSAALALSTGASFPDAAALHTSIGDALTLLGEYDAALQSYQTSAAFGAQMADANIARVYLRRGEWERAAHHLQNALAAKPEAVTRAQLYVDLAFAQHQLHDDASAFQHARRALQLARNAKDDQALAQCHNILGILARTRGAWDTAREHLEASRMLSEKRGDVGAHAAALNNLARVHHAMNDDARALDYFQRALELVTRAGDRHRQAALHNHLADLYHTLGREADSMEQLKRAVAIYAEIGGGDGVWQPEIWKLEEW